MNMKNKMSSVLKVSEEIFENIPLVNLVGNTELTIENYKGIVLYSENKVRINTQIGIITINGHNLALTRVLTEKISITGKIIEVNYANND